MILGSQEVVQPVDGEDRARFIKEIVHAPGPEPLAMVRKRLPDRDTPPGGYHAAVLLTHGFGQNRYAWHLSQRSFANHLAREGFDVFNLDLRGHGRSRWLGARPCGAVDEYIHEDLPAALAEVLSLTGRSRAFLVGHSLGGLVAYAAAPSLGEQVQGIVTVGSPYAFGQGNRVLLALARALALSVAKVRVRTPLPMTFIREMFRSQRDIWNSRLFPSPVRAWGPGGFERPVLDEYLRLAFDTATIGELLQTVASGTRGRFASVDGTIDYATAWEALDLPLLVLAGTRDLLAPIASVRPAYDRSASTDKTLQTFPMGHGDLILGRDAPRTTWPAVSAWLSRRAGNSPGLRPPG